MKKTSFVSLVSVVTIGLTLAGGATASASTKISMVGSTALQPLAETAAKSYMSDHKSVSIDVQGAVPEPGFPKFPPGQPRLGTRTSSLNNNRGLTLKSCKITRWPSWGWHRSSTQT